MKKQLKQNINISPTLNFLDKFKKIDCYNYMVENFDNSQIDLRIIGDQIFEKLNSGIAVAFNQGLDKPSAVVVVSKDLNEKGILAGKLANDIGELMGGGGGGKAHLATAGGQKGLDIVKILNKTEKLILHILKG